MDKVEAEVLFQPMDQMLLLEKVELVMVEAVVVAEVLITKEAVSFLEVQVKQLPTQVAILYLSSVEI